MRRVPYIRGTPFRRTEHSLLGHNKQSGGFREAPQQKLEGYEQIPTADELRRPPPPAPARRASPPRCCSASPARARPSSMATKVIEETQRPALILAPNKTLAAQLYGEFKLVLPRQRGRVLRLLLRLLPARGLRAAHRHLHREGKLDQRADRPDAPLGHPRAAGARRRDHRRVRVVHLRYRLGGDLHRHDLPADQVGERIAQRQLLADLVALQYKRNDQAFQRGAFRVRGDTVEVFPAHLDDRAWRHLVVRRRDRGDRRVRPAHRPQVRHPRKRQDLRQLALRHAQADPQPGRQAIKAELNERLEEFHAAGRCWKPSGWSSAPCSTSR
jgi:excinuclease ABC subunit B